MHDLLNDLAKFVCGDICFRLEVDRGKRIPKTTRHFSFSISKTKYFDGLGSLHDGERLHTFIPTDRVLKGPLYRWHLKVPIDDFLSKFKFLRVISLFGCNKLTEVPQSVGNLKHLCSLDLSGTAIEKLPESTCSLYYLLILKLANCRHFKELPPNLHKLTNLRFFDLSSTGIDELPESICSLFNLQILKLNNCSCLKELPSNLHKLTNLHCLEFKLTRITKVPPHLEKLKNLQVCMSKFDVGKSREFTVQQLGELNVHGSLLIENLMKIENPSDALAMGLKNKTHLLELRLDWCHQWMKLNRNDSPKEREEIVIENLKPSKQLKKLSIRNYGGTKFPSWLSDNSLWNVVSLKLYNCQCCQRLPSLGILPFLKELEIAKLDGIVSIDADFYGSESFSFTSLETLKFCDMKEWERWECEGVTGAFPRLKYLYVWNCPKLKGDLPVQNLHLMVLKISRCEQLEACAPKTLMLELEDSRKLQFDWAAFKRLKIGGHNMGASMVEMIGHNTSLKGLNVYCCPEYWKMCSCNFQMSDGYDSLKTFPLDLFPTLVSLTISGFPDLQMISVEHAHNHLKFLTIMNCPELESLPERMDILLSPLRFLEISDCPKVEWVGCLSSNLKSMNLNNCSKLVASLKGAFGANPSLEFLEVGKLDDDAESFPEEGLLPLSLTRLWIRNCKSLKKLEYKGLRHLSSLEQLYIRNCPKLECLPEEGPPKSISHLSIAGCPLVKQRCKEITGEDWPKIAHIQYLYIGEY